VEIPTAAWQKSASNFLTKAVDQLWQDRQVNIRQWLHLRGLNDNTIRNAQLGWHPQDAWDARHHWGLQEIINGGKRKKLWLPAGLIIPYIYNGEILRLRVRRFSPTDKWGRYVVISGSTTSPMQLPGIKDAYLVTESELDGWLLSQKATELTGVVALGSAQIKPDYGLDRKLQKARLILIALDSDLTGAKQTCRWWLKQYGNARWWPIPLQYGKDPGEAFQKGFDLKSWVKAALKKYCNL
jgi:hypothetical protein